MDTAFRLTCELAGRFHFISVDPNIERVFLHGNPESNAIEGHVPRFHRLTLRWKATDIHDSEKFQLRGIISVSWGVKICV